MHDDGAERSRRWRRRSGLPPSSRSSTHSSRCGGCAPAAPGTSGVVTAVQAFPSQCSASGTGTPAANFWAPTAQQSDEETQVTPKKPPLERLGVATNDQLVPFHSWTMGWAPTAGASTPTAQHCCALAQAVPNMMSSPPSDVAGELTMFQPEGAPAWPVARGRATAAPRVRTRTPAASERGHLGRTRYRRPTGKQWSRMMPDGRTAPPRNGGGRLAARHAGGPGHRPTPSRREQ